MTETMALWVEVWPLAADESGIWLVSGHDAWRAATPVMADSEPHHEVELLLAAHDALSRTALLHSTSWRIDGPAAILTYVAVLQVGDLVPASWPNALPVSADIAEAVGPAPTNAANEAPIPRYIDVLKHAIRHLSFLANNDATAANALPQPWPTHLSQIRPALAGMYSRPHQPI